MKATPKLPRNCAFAVCAAVLLASGAARAQMPFAPFGGRSATLGGAAIGLGAALQTLSDPGNGLGGNGNVGLAIAHGGWELSFTDWGYSGLAARVDLEHTALGTSPATSIAFNDSAAAFRGLELMDLALSKSMSFFLGRLTVGAAVHALWGTTYTKEESVFTVDVSDPFSLAQRALTGTSRSHTDWSFDLGGWYRTNQSALGVSVTARVGL